MDILMKYAKKKTIITLSTVLSGIVTALWLYFKISTPSATGMGELDSMDTLMAALGSVITIVQILFYVLLVLAVATAILSGVYFFMKDKKDYIILGEFITSTINSVLLLLSISGVNTICKLVKVAISGDYSSLMSMDYTGAMSAIASTASNLKYFMYLSILVFIFNIIVLLIAKKVITINGFDFSLDETASATAGTSSSDTGSTHNASVNTASMSEFFKTKNGKTVLGVIAAIVICFAGYKIYDTFFNYTKIDLAANITCDFQGKDGRGYLTNVRNDIDYDKGNPQLETFINTTYLDYDTDGNLSNGDKVTIKVSYSAETAKANKIKVTNDSKTFTVKGLTERYKKAKNLPSKLVKQLKTEADSKIKKSFNDGYSTTYKTEFDSLWFAKGDEYDYDRAVAVYKIVSTYTSSYSGETKADTYYVAVYTTNIDSDYLEDSSHYWYQTNLYGTDYQKLTDPQGILNAVKDRFDDYQIEKINVK